MEPNRLREESRQNVADARRQPTEPADEEPAADDEPPADEESTPKEGGAAYEQPTKDAALDLDAFDDMGRNPLGLLYPGTREYPSQPDEPDAAVSGSVSAAPGWSRAPGRSKYRAAMLAILLGDFGIHKFYLGKAREGIVYLLF